jgi:hypothetical protein
MGICGSRTAAQDSRLPTEIHRTASEIPGSRWLVWFSLMSLCMIASLSAGCMTTRYGWQPQVDRLATLQPGISKPGEVLMALGEPRGYGTVRYIKDVNPRKIWFYEYLETSGFLSADVKVKFLLIIFDNEAYEGYFWFFSGSRTETEWFLFSSKASSVEKRP